MKIASKVLAIATILWVAAFGNAQAETIKREFRSTWVSTVWGLDWPHNTTGVTEAVKSQQQKLLTDYLDKMADANFTSVCFQIRSRADAYYKSKYAPWTSDVSGTRGKDPGWDPLAFCIEEGHKRGLEVYAWINPYRWSTASDWTTATDKKWINDGWILRFSSSSGTHNYFNPGLKAVHDHVIDVCTEIIDGYSVDGLIIDDYFYPNGLPTTSAAGDYNLWKNSGTSLTLADWRRSNVNQLVADIYAMVQQHKPDVRFGIGPPGVAGKYASRYGLPSIESYGIYSGDWQYDGQFTDPLQWLFAGTIDFISPQIYWATTHSTAPFGPITNWWSLAASKAGRHHYASHSISSLKDDNSTSAWAEKSKQIGLSRQYTLNNAPGYNLFRTAFISGPDATGYGNYLKTYTSPKKALQPEITWKPDKMHSYAAPSGAALSSGKLVWDAVTDGNRIIKYSVYAVPSSVTLEAATRSDGDGILSDYLLGVSYTNSFTLPSNRLSGYWYAICVYDGFSHEHPAAYVGLAVKQDAPATSLTAPANGAEVEGDVTFAWTNVNVDSYILQISNSSTFVNIVKQSTLTSTSTSFNASEIGVGKFYWRVITAKANCNNSVSDVRSFTVKSVPTGGSEPGYVVKTDGSYYGSDGNFTLKNIWTRTVGDGNFATESSGALNRGFAARADGVYLSGRVEASQNSVVYLRRYDRFTGEHISDIILNGGQAPYFPCNDVIKDAKGNLIIYNLTLKIDTNPLVLHLVDVNTGELTELCSLTYSGGGRVDHCGVYGDVTSGNYYVFAPIASSNRVLRWQVTNGVASKYPNATSIGSFYPASAANVGIAPVVIPLSSDEFYINGDAIALSRYKFVTSGVATPVGSFSNANASVRPDASHNGGVAFTIDNSSYVVSPATKFDSALGYTWDVLRTDSDHSFASMQHSWSVPQAGLGKVDSKTYQARCDFVDNGDHTGTIYVYAPGNGLAAYTISSNNNPSGVAAAQAGIEVNVYGSMVVLSDIADRIEIYNMAGSLLASASRTNVLESNLSKGVYVLRVASADTITTKRIVIK